MPTIIKYNGVETTALADGKKRTLHVANKTMDGDIEIVAEQGASGGGDEMSDLELLIAGPTTVVNLPNITEMRQNAFYGNKYIKEVNIPNVTSVPTSCFMNVTTLNKVDMPKVEMINQYGFRGTGFKELILPESVRYIYDYGFYSCSQLSSVTFQSKPNSISTNVFGSCSNLKTINVPWSEGEVANAPWGATNATINYNYKVV